MRRDPKAYRVQVSLSTHLPVLDELAEKPRAPRHLRVFTFLDETSILEDDDAVGIAEPIEIVADHEHRAALHELLQSVRDDRCGGIRRRIGYRSHCQRTCPYSTSSRKSPARRDISAYSPSWTRRPFSRTTMRSASRSRSRSWLIMSTVRPCMSFCKASVTIDAAGSEGVSGTGLIVNAPARTRRARGKAPRAATSPRIHLPGRDVHSRGRRCGRHRGADRDRG